MYEKLVDRLRCPNIHSCPMDKSKISCRQCQKDAITEAADAISKLQSELEQAKRERDEAISWLRYSGECYGCLYAFDDKPALCEDCNESEENCNESCTWFGDPCGNCDLFERDNWQWRGVKEADYETD